MNFNSFEDLEVWKKSRQFRLQISEIAKSFPKEEKFRLGDQIIRSSRSVAANIAEGFGRFHHQENIQFCRIARGSLYETLEHLICAFDEKYISKEIFEEIHQTYNDVIKLLNGYIAYLKKSKSTN